MYEGNVALYLRGIGSDDGDLKHTKIEGVLRTYHSIFESKRREYQRTLGKD